MKKTAAALAVLAALVLVPALANSQAIQSAIRPYAQTFTSTAPSGSAGFVLQTPGSRICLEPACGAYITDNGTNVAQVVATGGITLQNSVTLPANLSVTSTGAISTANGAVSVGGANGRFVLGAATLSTCAAGSEGAFVRQTGTGGTNSGSQTRFCACVSDGAASPTYSWRNVISGTAGNSTTCNP